MEKIYFKSNDGSQNTLVLQPEFDTLVGYQRRKLILNLIHYTAFLHSIKLSEYRIETKVNKNYLAVEQNNSLNRIVYIVYDIDALP